MQQEEMHNDIDTSQEKLMQETLIYLTETVGNLQDKFDRLTEIVSGLMTQPREDSKPKYKPNPSYQHAITQPNPIVPPALREPPMPAPISSTGLSQEQLLKAFSTFISQYQQNQSPTHIEQQEFSMFVPPVSTGKRCQCANPIIQKPDPRDTTIPGALKCMTCDVIYLPK